MMTDTEKIDLIFRATKYLAELWVNFGGRNTFDRVVRIRGVNVRVIVENADTSPRGESALEIMRSEQGQDL